MSYPFRSLVNGDHAYGGGAGGSLSSRPVKLRAVTLTHLSPSSQPATATGSQQQQSHAHTSSQGGHVNANTDRNNADNTDGEDPFALLSQLPHRHPHAAQTPRHGSFDDGGNSSSSNLAKWSAFGLNTAAFGHVQLSPPVAQSSHPVRPRAEAAGAAAGTSGGNMRDITAGNADGDDDDVLFCGSASSLASSTGALVNTEVAPARTGSNGNLVADDGDDVFLDTVPSARGDHPPQDSTAQAGSSSMAQLRRQLYELSGRVTEAEQLMRCGPPRAAGGGKAGQPHANRWKRQQQQRKKKKDDGAADDDDDDDDDNNNREDGGGATAGAPGTAAAKDDADGNSGGRKRSRTAAAGGRKPSAKAARKPRKGAKTAASDGPQPQWRSLFPIAGQGGMMGVPGTAGTCGGPAAEPGSTLAGCADGGGGGGATAQPFTRIDSSSALDALFRDIEAALSDPDRIQAPPLFLSVRFTSGETNISLSSRTHGRAFLPSSTTNPRGVHRSVDDFVFRWRDKVYVAAAQQYGFRFVLRVLQELVGVEVITFAAPCVFLPLLSRVSGDLATPCVSDVRLMAWMASLAVSAAVPTDGEAGGHGPAAGWGEAPANTAAPTHDFAALLEQHTGKSAEVIPPAAAPPHSRATQKRGAVGGSSLQQLVNETYYLAPLYRALYSQLGAKGLLQAFLRQEKRIPLLLASMKYEGIRVSMKEVHRFREHCTAQMQHWRAKAGAFVPGLVDFNIQSPDQVRHVLYDVLQLGRHLPSQGGSGGGGGGDGDDGLLSMAVTKGGKLSTAEGTLRVLGKFHEFPRCILNYRKVAKVMQTYVEGMMSFAVPCEGPEGGDDGSSTSNGVDPVGIQMDHGGEDVSLASSCSAFRDVALLTSPDGAATADDRRSGDLPPPQHASFTNAAEEEEDLFACAAASQRDSAPTPKGPTPTPPDARCATLHPNFLQEGTDTGRLSCVEPNMQNLPRTAMQGEKTITNPTTAAGALAPHLAGPGKDRAPAAAAVPVGAAAAPAEVEGEEEEEEDLMFRRCFVAPPGFTLLSVDYQQIELRVLAHLCADAALVDALAHGNADIHRTIAELVFRKSPVSAEERNASKKVVFGTLYGAGPRTLAAQMGVTVERAVHISSLLRSAFPQINTYHAKVIQQGREEGFVRTMSGRIRRLPDMNAPVMAKRAYAERQAFNTVIQGSAADLMKMAMLAVERDVLRPLRGDVQLIMQIHDEMIFTVRSEKLPMVVGMVTKAMARAVSLLVPLQTTAKFGPSLGDLQEWTVDHDLGLA